MRLEFRVPDIGAGIAEVEIVEWHVAVGDEVTVFDALATIATDKAIIEMPCPVTGRVVRLGADAGGVLEVGDLLVVVDLEDEHAAAGLALAETARTRATPLDVLVARDDGVLSADGAPACEASRSPRPRASPAVRRLALENRVDVGRVRGSGPGGRVIREDVMQASAGEADLEQGAADWRRGQSEKLSGFAPHHGIYVSKTDLVAAALRELMITGDLQPGTRLRQRELAARFRVSPTPVREALRRLESEGLVSYGTHRGSTVAQSDTGAEREKFLIRAELEGLASSLAAPKITEEEIADLHARNERLLEPELSQHEINELNRAFHFRIYETARSPLLLSLMRLLWRSFPGGPRALRTREESHDQHRALLEALERRDGEAAMRITRHHILGAMAHLAGAAPPEPEGQ